MKVAIITDTHLGIRNGSIYFLSYQRERWVELFEYMKKNGIKVLLHGGDFFDNRNSISLTSLVAVTEFNALLKEYDIELTMIVGNHDVAFKNDNTVNSPEALLNCEVIWERPVTKTFGKMSIDLIPWINNANYGEVQQFISKSKSPICLGHFEINGAPFHKGGHICEGGIDASLFQGYKKALSGHFHTRSKVGKVEYIGAGFDYTWADWNDPRGFVVLDTDTLDMEYVDWSSFMFVMGEMDEEGNVSYLPDCDSIDGKYVRIVVNTKTNKKIEAALSSLEARSPIEMQVFFKDDTVVNNTVVDVSEATDETHVIKVVLEEALENVEFRSEVQSYLEQIFREASSQ